MASFWRPGYDPRRRTLPAIAEDAEEENVALPTTHAGPSGAASSCPPPSAHNQDEPARDTSPSAHDETGPGRTSAADAGPSSSTQRQEDDSPAESTTNQEPLTGKERLARRLARHPEFRPHPGTGFGKQEEEVRLWLFGVMHVLAEVREGVNVLRERLARRAAASVPTQPASEPEQLTRDEVDKFVQLAAAEYQRRFGEPAGA